MANKSFVIETSVKSLILKKIATEVARRGGTVSLDSYYKDPNGGGGGVYGKGEDPVFGKSEPTKQVDLVINIANQATVRAGVAKAAIKLKKAIR